MSFFRTYKPEPQTAIEIVVNGRAHTAYQGETVLAALLAAGYLVLNHSKSLREPRSALCGMGLCQGCLVSIDGVPNQRACSTLVKPDMEVVLDAH